MFIFSDCFFHLYQGAKLRIPGRSSPGQVSDLRKTVMKIDVWNKSREGGVLATPGGCLGVVLHPGDPAEAWRGDVPLNHSCVATRPHANSYNKEAIMLIPVSSSNASCQPEDVININIVGETSARFHGSGLNDEEILDNSST